MVQMDFKRKLAAILCADVEGYSRLMDDDEEATVRTLTAYRNAITDLTQQFRGRVVDTPGDNILAEFSSVVDAVNCAVEIQRELAERNAELHYNRKMEFRIGVNLGDIIEEDGRIYGDGVNIAARVESLAEAGGICISGRAHDQVENKLGLEYEDLGKHEVKNISRPIQVYRVLSYPGAAAHRVVQAKETLGRKWLNLAILAAVLAVVAAVGIWQFYLRRPTIEPASEEKMAFPLPDEPSIAVLPFDNISGNPDQEYIADGITENIITGLSQIPDMFVIANNSVFTYKGKPVKIKQVSEELGVRYVLEGSVQRAEDRLRVTAQLIDALKGHHLWAERYDRELKDLFALQDDITMKVLNAMEVKLTVGEVANWYRTDNFEAWSLFTRGFSVLNRNTKKDILEARKLFEQAANLEPDYAPAWTMQAWTHTIEVSTGLSKSPEESISRAFELSQKSAALGEDPARLHSLMGVIYRLQGRFDEAITEGEKAVALIPNEARVHIFLAQSLRFGGRPEDAIVHTKKAMRLEPYYPAWFLVVLGDAYEMAGHYEEAIATWNQLYKRSLKGEYPLLWVHERLALNYARLDRMEEASFHSAEILKIKPDYTVAFYRKGKVYKDKAYLEKSFDLLRKAGLPDKTALPLPDKPSIAVLAFDNLSNDPEQEYFSDGLAEDIITALSKTPKMFVIARNSSFSYKGKPVKVQQIGRELGVRYVLEGSVRKIGEQVRITAQLVDAKTGHHLWAEKYDRELEDVFALQDEVTINIIGALEVKLTEGEQARIHAKGTDNLAAYLNVIEAKELARHHNIEHNRKARQLLEKAIELDPNYAQAYRWLSSVNSMDVILGASKAKEESLKTAVELAKKALSIDRYLGDAHGIIGWTYFLSRQYEKAKPELKKALELEPNGADIYLYLAAVLLYNDELDEGILMANKAIRLNPIPPSLYLNIFAALYRSKGDYEEALVWSEKAVKQEPENTIARANLSSIYYLSGRAEDAHLQAKEVLKLNPKFSVKKLEKALPYKNPEVKKQYIDALRNAGLPD